MAAQLFTSADNGRFARTFVNRVWDRFFGRGLVPSVDDLDGKPFDADLLDWLAADFADHHYDMQFLIERIMTSDAYQLPSVPKPERTARRVRIPRTIPAPPDRGAVRRRRRCHHRGMEDPARSQKPEPGVFSREWRFKSSPLTRALGRPIRDQVYTERNERRHHAAVA